jgi:hypothetical protein
MPLQATSGAASYDAFGGGVPVVPQYIEEVFQTWLYTGNGSTQTITNGVDLAGKGGLVWGKSRSVSADNVLVDSTRGIANTLVSNSTGAQNAIATAAIGSFNNNGFSFSGNSDINANPNTYVSWTFRKQPKFFDIVTWTGDGTSGRSISHSLGSAPACVFVKRTNSAADWVVYHRSLSESASYSYNLFLNLTLAQANDSLFGLHSQQTSTQFKLGSNANAALINNTGDTYVAYLFAHNAGGFGLTGTDNVISCGSYSGSGAAGNAQNLGYEPQWVLIKRTDSADDWHLFDNMRGIATGGNDAILYPNLSNAEFTTGNRIALTATGFTFEGSNLNASGGTYIYIAIRRGPMKVPTSGTSVLGLNARSGTGANATVTGGAGVSDAVIVKNRGSAVASLFSSRLTGTGYLVTSSTAAEAAAGTTILQANPWDVMDGVKVGTTSTITNASSNTYINYLFDRAPSVFDVVCFSVPNSGDTVTHNLTVIPELMIVKDRNAGSSWYVYHKDLGATKYLKLQTTDDPFTNIGAWNNTAPTSTVFTVGGFNTFFNYVAYLFATCAGVSKVGSYTGTATTKQIDCGFTAGARFVLIKRTDSTGDWYVWDTARGIVSGNDSYLLLNTTAAEVTNTDYVDTYSAGFEISSTAPAAINASGGTFIFLAIA